MIRVGGKGSLESTYCRLKKFNLKSNWTSSYHILNLSSISFWLFCSVSKHNSPFGHLMYHAERSKAACIIFQRTWFTLLNVMLQRIYLRLLKWVLRFQCSAGKLRFVLKVEGGIGAVPDESLIAIYPVVI